MKVERRETDDYLRGYPKCLTVSELDDKCRRYNQAYLEKTGENLDDNPDHPKALRHLECDHCGLRSLPYPLDFGEVCTSLWREFREDGWHEIDDQITCWECFEDAIQDDSYYAFFRRRTTIIAIPERFRSGIESPEFDPDELPTDLDEWLSTCLISTDDEEVSRESCAHST